MVSSKETKTVEETLPPTVWDTQKIKKHVLEAARLITVQEATKLKAQVIPTVPKSPPYLIVILLMVVFGFGALILLAAIRPDLDIVVIAGVILPTVTVITASVFNSMQRSQTIQEAHEANINSQLALVQSKETHDIVNSKFDEYKETLESRLIEQVKFAAAEAYSQGLRVGSETADARTDKLAEEKKAADV